MPHIIIEASQNVVDLVDPKEIVARAHAAAAQIEGFPLPGIRTRLHLAESFRMADGNPKGVFVHANIRIGGGFSENAHQAGAKILADALSELFAAFQKTVPVAISVEVTELNTATRINLSNVREFLEPTQ